MKHPPMIETSARDRVVLIAYHFPPDPAVGSLRAAKVARAFLDSGRRVDVITASLPGETGMRRTEDPALRVHPVALLPNPGEIFLRLRARLLGRRPHQQGLAPDSGVAWTPPTRVPGWKRLLFSLLWLPDDRQGFMLPAWGKARSLVQAGAGLVYTTAPPYSPHLVGLALKSMMGVRWVMELRDPWVDSPQKPWWVRTRATDALDARLERACLRRADLVVVASDGIRRGLAARLPVSDSSRLVLVRNGIDHLTDSAPSRRGPGPVRIVYAGSFYHCRDPRPFLRGLAAVRRKLRMGPAQVRVDFIGSCRSVGPVSVDQELNALGLTDIVQIRDWLPHAAAKRLLDESDVLLLLAQQQPDQVPNKLYEYLGTRRPILAFGDADGETTQMLQRVGGHYVVTGEDEAEVERVVREALTSATLGNRPVTDDRVLKEWTTDVQLKTLIAAVWR
jgi:Glycosyl transferase 4-like domain